MRIPQNSSNQYRIPAAAFASVEALAVWCISALKAGYGNVSRKELPAAQVNTLIIQRNIFTDDDKEDSIAGRFLFKMDPTWSGELVNGANVTLPNWQKVIEIDSGLNVQSRFLSQ
jgi:hypothetical protein